ncbi:MAG: phage Gp37/Gp68 family protein [Candidatus Marinimicrobia bacterium]|nr:phage Gp37/Gp68 family protein [Candidatus Neomarinimicrobiota bacterium]
MKHGTAIEWTHIPGYKGETWNPTVGCTKVSSGCTNCYAERLVNGRLKHIYPDGFDKVILRPDRLETPLRWKKPRAIFVDSMSDLFHENISAEFIDKVLAVAALTPQHIYMILTKRPERMQWHIDELLDEVGRKHLIDSIMDQPDWVSLPKGRSFPRYIEVWPLPNVWLGVSVEDQATADERIWHLLQTPAAVRFVSYEPALGPVNFNGLQADGVAYSALEPGNLVKEHIDQIIAGGESGPRARPSHPDWFRTTRDQCAAAGVPFFFKQWGEWIGQNLLEFDHAKQTCTKVDGWLFYKVGKKAAGHLLDGVAHQAWPVSADATPGKPGQGPVV